MLSELGLYSKCRNNEHNISSRGDSQELFLMGKNHDETSLLYYFPFISSRAYHLT